MPIYVYRCRICDEQFEALRGMTDTDDTIECPRCGEMNPRRVVSAVCGGKTDPNRGNLRIPT